jgi:sorbitol-specific phosphotransferase system component IIBC
MAFVDDSQEDDFGNFKSMSGVSVTKKKTRSKNNDKMQINASGVDESDVQKLEERLTALVAAEADAKKQEQADAEAKRQREIEAKKELVDTTILELGKVVAIRDRIKKVQNEVTPFTTSEVASVKAEAIMIYNSASDLVARCMNMQGELLEVVRSLDPNHYVLTAKL